MNEQALSDRAHFWGRVVDVMHVFAKTVNQAAGISISLSVLLAVVECARGFSALRTLVCFGLTFCPCFLLAELAYRIAQFALWRMRLATNRVVKMRSQG